MRNSSERYLRPAAFECDWARKCGLQGHRNRLGYIFNVNWLLYIEEVQPHWPDAAKARGKWYLLIARDEWITDDLETLERKLYDWAASEGYFEGKDSIEAESA